MVTVSLNIILRQNTHVLHKKNVFRRHIAIIAFVSCALCLQFIQFTYTAMCTWDYSTGCLPKELNAPHFVIKTPNKA